MTISQPPAIFLSHSSKDSEFAVRLVEDLRRLLRDDKAVWYDTKGGLDPGDPWFQKIENEIIARDIFIIILSANSMNSLWVRREFDIALNEKKRIIPVLYQSCQAWPYLRTIHHISCLPPKSYEGAFDELLVALGFVVNAGARQVTNISGDSGTGLVQQMMPQIQTCFTERDWSAVIYRVNFLIRRTPNAIPSVIYSMQGRALFEEGEKEHAQEAFDTALALANTPAQRLMALNEYAIMLSSLLKDLEARPGIGR